MLTSTWWRCTLPTPENLVGSSLRRQTFRNFWQDWGLSGKRRSTKSTIPPAEVAHFCWKRKKCLVVTQFGTDFLGRKSTSPPITCAVSTCFSTTSSSTSLTSPVKTRWSIRSTGTMSLLNWSFPIRRTRSSGRATEILCSSTIHVLHRLVYWHRKARLTWRSSCTAWVGWHRTARQRSFAFRVSCTEAVQSEKSESIW